METLKYISLKNQDFNQGAERDDRMTCEWSTHCEAATAQPISQRTSEAERMTFESDECYLRIQS